MQQCATRRSAYHLEKLQRKYFRLIKILTRSSSNFDSYNSDYISVYCYIAAQTGWITMKNKRRS
jgi:hypothetical protein